MAANAAYNTVGSTPRIGRSGFPTSRRPHRRPLDVETPADVVSAWIMDMGITIGVAAATPDQREMVERLCFTYRDVFATDLKDIRATDLCKHSIPLKPGARPFLAKMPLFTREEEDCMASKLPELEKAGIVARCDSPWVSKLKFVRKKDGSLRWVNAFCPLNKATVKEPYPIPRLEAIFNSLAQPQYTCFASLDGSNGYWSIPMEEEHVPKTAFFTPLGLYCWVRMGQGLTGAVFTYSRFADLAFGPIPEPSPEPRLEDPVIPGATFRKFIDDNCFAARDFWTLFRLLAEHYFPRCAWAPVALAPRKAFLFTDEIDVMGFKGSLAGLRPDERKLAAFRNIPAPTSWAEVERFCYMTPYLRWFIPGRAEHCKVIKSAWNPTTKTFCWTPACQTSFLHIKNAVLNNAVSSGDPSRQYHIATDASKTGCGGVLFQITGDVPAGTQSSLKTRPLERLVMFMSRSFNLAQQNYSTTDREALGCLVGLEEARPLILGSHHPTFLYTDHQALTKMLTSDDTRGRIARWQNRFAEYDVIVVHVPGRNLALADGLSRVPPAAQGPPVTEDFESSLGIFDTVPPASVSEALAVVTFSDWRHRELLSASVPVVSATPLRTPCRVCRSCGEAFSSGAKLHAHLHLTSHHSSGPDSSREYRAPMVASGSSRLHRFRKRSSRSRRTDVIVSLLDAVREFATTRLSQVLQACSMVLDSDCCVDDEESASHASLALRLDELLGSHTDQDGWEVSALRLWHLWLADPFYGPVVQFKLFGRVGDNNPKLWDQRRQRYFRRLALRFRMVEDGKKARLYYCERKVKGGVDEPLARCVMEEEVPLVLKQLHDNHGHLASRLTITACFGKFYWPTRVKDIVEYCRRCQVCQKTGNKVATTARTNRPMLQLAPWDMIGMDWLTVSPAAHNSHLYIHIIIDYFSRYICLQSSTTHTSNDTTAHCQERFKAFGVPRKVYCDNGPHFAKAETPIYLRMVGCTQILAPVTHPASVGLSEVFVQMVRALLRKLCLLDPRGSAWWPDYVGQVEWALNNRVMKVHGYTPAQLFFGRETRYNAEDYQVKDDFVEDLKLGTMRLTEMSDVFGEQQIHPHWINLEESRASALNAVLDHQDRLAAKDASKPQRTFNEGDLVLWRNFVAHTAVGKKMLPKWIGPYEVVKVLHHQASCILREVGTKVDKGRNSVNTLKLWVTREERLEVKRLE